MVGGRFSIPLGPGYQQYGAGMHVVAVQGLADRPYAALKRTGFFSGEPVRFEGSIRLQRPIFWATAGVVEVRRASIPALM